MLASSKKYIHNLVVFLSFTSPANISFTINADGVRGTKVEVYVSKTCTL